MDLISCSDTKLELHIGGVGWQRPATVKRRRLWEGAATVMYSCYSRTNPYPHDPRGGLTPEALASDGYEVTVIAHVRKISGGLKW
jgi:hypothetical protein